MRTGIHMLMLITLLVAVGCGGTNKLEYKGNWEGNYRLIEYNCCGDTATKVKMEIVRERTDEYKWKLFLGEEQADTLTGIALYKKNKLKFYATDPEVATKYFSKTVSLQSPVFWMEDQKQGSYYTWWYNDLKKYRRGKMLFAGYNEQERTKQEEVCSDFFHLMQVVWLKDPGLTYTARHKVKLGYLRNMLRWFNTLFTNDGNNHTFPRDSKSK